MVTKNLGIYSGKMVAIITIVLVVLFVTVEHYRQLPKNHYLYYVGHTTLKDAVLVNYKDGTMFVAPSAVAEKCMEPGWRNRPDVYPYILVPAKTMAQYANQNLINTSLLSQYRPFDKHYEPYVYPERKTIGDSIWLYRFNYDIESFDMYFMANNGDFYSPRGDDNLDSFKYDHTYRVALRAHFSLWQIIRLKREFIYLEQSLIYYTATR